MTEFSYQPFPEAWIIRQEEQTLIIYSDHNEFFFINECGEEIKIEFPGDPGQVLFLDNEEAEKASELQKSLL